jgi:NAD(P)-dependent dehydrogenase (short-subunit alcohol dehydrogenase family)
MFDLTGRTALVTGAGQGVGAGIAVCLADQGATVVVNDYFAERAQNVADRIVAAGGSAVVAPFDVTDLAAVTSAVGTLGRTVGPVDILVNNAGISATTAMVPTRFRDMSPEDWEQPISINLYGVMHCCKAVLDGMAERGWGRIITISSGAGTAGVGIGVAPYSAGKGGGVAFTRTLALEVARTGITANTLAIGLMEQRDPTVTAGLAKAIPVGRTGTPEDVGAACVWLASDEAAWVTGQTIGINGGSTTS